MESPLAESQREATSRGDDGIFTMEEHQLFGTRLLRLFLRTDGRVHLNAIEK
jgi:hypothetical protein